MTRGIPINDKQMELDWIAHFWIDRTVTLEEGEKKAKELNVMFIETSAKAGHNVSTATGNMHYTTSF